MNDNHIHNQNLFIIVYNNYWHSVIAQGITLPNRRKEELTIVLFQGRAQRRENDVFNLQHVWLVAESQTSISAVKEGKCFPVKEFVATIHEVIPSAVPGPYSSLICKSGLKASLSFFAGQKSSKGSWFRSV